MLRSRELVDVVEVQAASIIRDGADIDRSSCISVGASDQHVQRVVHGDHVLIFIDVQVRQKRVPVGSQSSV